MQKVKTQELVIFSALILFACLGRMVPHLANFTPVIAVSVFAGFVFRNYLVATIVPLAALFVSDYFIGLYEGMQWIYLCHIAVLFSCILMKSKLSSKLTMGVSPFVGALVFFLGSNAVVWATTNMYAKDLSGLWQSYVMAIPFFKSTLISTVVYSYALFGVRALYKATVSSAVEAN